tara:strand:- start:98 stop:355 length:258 start_codon:yes stop_codon:yes gene_type:complete
MKKYLTGLIGMWLFGDAYLSITLYLNSPSYEGSPKQTWKHNTDKRGLGHPAIFPEQLASDHITDAIAIGKYHAGILKLNVGIKEQ